MSKNKGDFFAVNVDRFADVAALGLNAACFYLIVACGSDKKNTNSSWSVAALVKYTSLGRKRAKVAKDLLIQSNLVSLSPKSTLKHPKYTIQHHEHDEFAWLPKQFVMGAACEVAPLELIRQTQDVNLLKVMLNLYRVCDFVEDSGVPNAYSGEREHSIRPS